MEPQELFDTKEAARELGISDSMIRYLVATGEAHPLRKVGRGWLFSSEEIERLRDRPKQKAGRPKKQEVQEITE